MRSSKLAVAGIVASVLMLGTGSLLLAAETPASIRAEKKAAKKRAAAKAESVARGPRAAAPAKPTGIAQPPDPGDTAYANDKAGTITEYRNENGQTVYSISASQFDISPPLSDMAASASGVAPAGELEGPSNPLLPPWRIGHSDIPDPVVQPVPTGEESLTSGGFTPAAPTTGFNFAGIPQSGGTPSDCNGSVGNGQFVETVNTRYQVWSLNYGTHVSTSLLGPSNINTLWSGFAGACSTQNAGDPVVIYDKVADRWLISQFTSSVSGGSYFQCVAVSTTNSATGTYARWAFAVPNGYFGDYPKIGAWSDAYYMSAHAFSGTTYVAGIFAAMDRPKMLAGNAAATWQAILDTNEGGHLPADVDGFAPPPTGAPGIFLSLHSSSMFLYRMKVDFVTPANTVKTQQAAMPIAAWSAACSGGTCIPQPGTTALLDSLADRLMFRAAYRNYIDHESLVVTHSVDPAVTGVVSGVRWYDFRISGLADATCPTYPCTHQQGTIADVANGRSRWMGSAAMDGAENMLVGYSTTGKTNGTENHSIRYTGRAKGDPLGTMTAAESTIQTATKNNTSSTRWGDYSSMSADPSDDCTLWYVSQYDLATSSFATKIASSSFPAGTGAGQCQAAACIATSRPASAPTIGTASSIGPNQISVTWTGIAPTPGAYAIERAIGACGSEGLYQPLAATPGANSSFTDTTVLGGFTYSYRIIAATDAAGKCQALAASGCASATATGNCTLKPAFTGAASGTSNNASTCGITLAFTAASSNCPLTPNVHYNIYRGTTPDFVPAAGNRIATCANGPSSYVDTTNVSSGVTYYYAVRAEDDSTVNGGPCNGGNEDTNAVVVPGTAYGPGTQASNGTWSDGGGDGTAFLQLNAAELGDTADQAWRFVSTATDAGANHTPGGAYAYRNAGPASTNTYSSSVCAEIQTPALTVGATTMNLQYWERHQLEYHWDGIAVEYSQNGGEWNDVAAPSNSAGVGCAAGDVTTGWETLECTTATPVNACGYSTLKRAYNGPLGSGTTCTNYATSATPTSYVHRCHQITGLVAGDTVKFRWRFSSDSAAVYGGFYLDDITATNIRLPNACSSNPCIGQADGTACNDGNACTQSDSCQGGVCVGTNPVTCTASDQCHAAGTCNTQTGLCSNPNAPNGSVCTDGNACTQTDTCQSGVCTGSNSVVCTASDQCHAVGTCAPATGVCSNPAAANGTGCSDGNGCTAGDTCQSGTCTSGSPVVCTALDQCHTAGTCNPANGTCSNPTVANGSPCNDGNACTQTDTCQAGTCSGSNPVTCTASDQCHTTGTCAPATGICSNPTAPNGTACNDGNACTQTDTCQSGTCSGSNPVTCTASNQCHTVGTCNPASGLCSNPAAPDGTACSDGNACTQTDTCQSGTCSGSNPVTCTASDQCHVAGTCAPATGVCSNPTRPDGTACNDGNACTQGDSCVAGLCTNSTPVVCAASDQCHTAGVCNPLNGVCSNPAAPDGSACNDGDACTQTDTCQAGSCAGGNPVTCTASDQCHTTGTCDPGTGACSNPASPDGSPCNDGDACTQTDTCQAGSCAGGNPVSCAPSDQCHTAGTCDPGTGACSNPAAPNGSACNDGNACTQTDTCQSGACAGSNPVTCVPLDQCHTTGTCNPASGVCSSPTAPDGTACDDGNSCTVTDACGAGICAGSAITAPPETQDVTVAADKTTYTWSAAAFATQYDVVRGSLAAFPVGPGGGDESCFDNLGGTSLNDATVPAPDTGFWYLSRGENACGIGSFGTDSSGSQRNTTTCP